MTKTLKHSQYLEPEAIVGSRSRSDPEDVEDAKVDWLGWAAPSAPPG